MYLTLSSYKERVFTFTLSALCRSAKFGKQEILSMHQVLLNVTKGPKDLAAQTLY
jgi:hypothetical protein